MLLSLILFVLEIKHTVLSVETVSRDNDQYTQLHKLLGMKRIYGYLDGENCTSTILQGNIIALISHYKGNFLTCFESSRCKTDENYIPFKDWITSTTVKDLLSKSSKSFPIYQNLKYCVHCGDTHYVESFNTSFLQYHDFLCKLVHVVLDSVQYFQLFFNTGIWFQWLALKQTVIFPSILRAKYMDQVQKSPPYL